MRSQQHPFCVTVVVVVGGVSYRIPSVWRFFVCVCLRELCAWLARQLVLYIRCVYPINKNILQALHSAIYTKYIRSEIAFWFHAFSCPANPCPINIISHAHLKADIIYTSYGLTTHLPSTLAPQLQRLHPYLAMRRWWWCGFISCLVGASWDGFRWNSFFWAINGTWFYRMFKCGMRTFTPVVFIIGVTSIKEGLAMLSTTVGKN